LPFRKQKSTLKRALKRSSAFLPSQAFKTPRSTFFPFFALNFNPTSQFYNFVFMSIRLCQVFLLAPQFDRTWRFAALVRRSIGMESSIAR
jgi:hypothetical protein